MVILLIGTTSAVIPTSSFVIPAPAGIYRGGRDLLDYV